jgi:hypothetical protein
VCLWSIARSARLCGITDYEVIVVDAASDPGEPTLDRVTSDPNVILVEGPPVTDLFNKPVLLNLGIDSAVGDRFSFIDCDAIVGDLWMEAWELFSRPPTLLFYRVRNLERFVLDALMRDDREELVRGWFDKYDLYDRSWEGYGPEVYRDSKPGKEGSSPNKTYGNSQLTITRENLGDLRYDPEYKGAGFEDLSFIRQVVRKFGDDYCGDVMTTAEYAMLHIRSPREPDWGHLLQNKANHIRYKTT